VGLSIAVNYCVKRNSCQPSQLGGCTRVIERPSTGDTDKAIDFRGTESESICGSSMSLKAFIIWKKKETETPPNHTAEVSHLQPIVVTQVWGGACSAASRQGWRPGFLMDYWTPHTCPCRAWTGHFTRSYLFVHTSGQFVRCGRGIVSSLDTRREGISQEYIRKDRLKGFSGILGREFLAGVIEGDCLV
jgi:hypothetical protein